MKRTARSSRRASLRPERGPKRGLAVWRGMSARGTPTRSSSSSAVGLSGGTSRYRRSHSSFACCFGGAAFGEIDARLAATAYVAGDAFSTADACLLPFLWRIDDSLELPAEFGHLRAYVARACAEPAFAATVVPSWWWWW